MTTEQKTELRKEKARARAKAYYQANREKKIAKVKIYDEANKEKKRAYLKSYVETNKLPYNVIYCIPDYDGKGNNYCGVSHDPKNRMGSHKHNGKINTNKWYELDRVVDRTEALAKEKEYHLKGYHGARPIKE